MEIILTSALSQLVLQAGALKRISLSGGKADKQRMRASCYVLRALRAACSEFPGKYSGCGTVCAYTTFLHTLCTLTLLKVWHCLLLT